MHHYHRGLAYAALGNVIAAEREQRRFREAVKKVPADAMVSVNKAHTTLSIADHMLAGEIAFRRGDLDDAIASLREAVRIEDTLLYTEPPDWVQPVRHTLGAVLVHAKRYDEAREVYEDDLKHWPENGWSLLGLAQSLRGMGKTAEADAVEQRFQKAWARADIRPGRSCLCVRGES
jgi:tetratricopeptide (TPR) repeat protein